MPWLLIGFFVFFTFAYLLAFGYPASSSKGGDKLNSSADDEESAGDE